MTRDSKQLPNPLARPIAVVGLACRYPGAADARSLWENILSRRRQFRTMPDCRLPLSDYHHTDPRAEDLTYGRWAAVMDGWSFDPVANRVPKSTFEATDVVHWLTLDIARQAVRHANLDLETADRDRIGMVLGNTLTGEETRANTLRLRWPFLRRALRHAAAATGLDEGDEARLEEALLTTWRSAFPKINEDSLAGGLANTIAGRVCNVLDLHGGGYVVDGACASSLLAVATAAQLLDSGQLDIALAGGVDMSLDPFELVGFAKATALSSGDMNVYDRRGKGFIPGEGCGVVVLQRLDDARRDGRQVLAVLKGWGVSSDGKGGITAPSVKGQALALRRAYERAGYSPHTLDFVEGHGTGTAVGDRVELEGIAQALEAWGTPPARGVGVTSFKSIVGHTKAAAGIGGFIKAVLAVNQRVIPPTAGCVDPHDAFAGSAAALYPVLKPQFLAPGATLRAGVSAMGFGGINSHVTLESGDAPMTELQVEPELAATPWACEVFPLRASSLEALRQDVAALREDAAGVAISELTDLAVALAQRTSEGPWRACVVASTVEELCSELDQLAARLAAAGSSTSGPGFASSLEPARLGFVFPGQGSQFIAMGAALVERYPWARERLAEADRTVADLPAFSITSLSAFILRPTWLGPNAEERQAWKEALTDTRVAQPAIALCSALWAEHLERLGVRPAIVAGHSLGELTALYASGAYDAPTLVRIAALRGQAMAAPAEHPGSMAALTCDATTARTLLGDTGAVIGNLNAPDQTVVSGPAVAIDQVIARATEQGVRANRLRVSNAFHSPLVAPASRALATDARVPTRALGRRTVPLSCTDGQAISKDVDLRAHLAAQITSPVDFLTLAQQLAERCDLLVEVGPGRVLSNLTERCAPQVRCLPVEGAPNGDREACLALCELFLSGQRVRWSVLHAGRFTRPFVPARARTFYRNPCERPFPALQASTGARPARELRATTVAQPLSQVAAQSADQGTGAATNLEARLFEMIESRTGFPASSLHSKLRLLDDLNLDSIKAGALLADMAREAGRPTAPPGLANASLGDILAAFAAAKTEAPRARTDAPGWVADFIVRWTPEPAASATAAEALTIVGEGPLATALASAVPGSRVLDDTLAGLTLAPRNLLVIMPEGPVDLRRDVARLACLAKVGERFAPSTLSRVTFVQRSDGRFGQSNPQADHTGVRSFAASVAQEHPELVVRALDVHPALAPERALDAVLVELGAAVSGAAGVDAAGLRSVPSLRRIDAFDAIARAPALRPGGTALVTGGGKGITAACGLALAQHTGCRLVLVGSSAPGPEVQQTLARMASANVQAVYRRCDVTDAQAVRQLVDAVAAELGPITAVLHGAGLNLPRSALKVGTDQALAEIGPKLLGCDHVLAALADRPPELVAALTSVIGVLGMTGNAWYAFSNERVDLALRRFASRHPATRVMAFAYSVWDEVGMGVRLGSVEGLGKRGIGAIPVEAGVRHFSRWLEQVPPDSQVVITSRMGALLQPQVATGRFAGSVVAHAPGVEHVVRLRLHPDQDTYVRDHDYRGSLLFPTVMGLEAMAQAALRCVGRDALGDVQIEDIVLERPIVVHPVNGEEIELRASCAERAQADDPLRVDVAIHTAATGFGSAHFKARFVWNAVDLVEAPPQVDGALDLDPQTDLYGGLLFQGPVFQRIRRVLQLNEKEVVFETEHRAQTLEAPEGFAESARAHLVAGDPYHRDTLLQAAQLVVSPDVALPVRIERIVLRQPSSRATGPSVARARFLGREGDTLFAEVAAWDAAGQLIERITGYALKVLERDERLPDVHRLLEPHSKDEQELQRRLDEAAQRWQLIAPRVAFAHQRGLHQQPRPHRRAMTEPLLRQAASRAGAPGHLGWDPSGRPVLDGGPDFGLSLSHDDAGALAVAGRGAQGCDLVGRDTHSAALWRAMLGPNAAVFDTRAAVDGVDFAGRMVWAAQEAGMKALGADQVALSLLTASADGAWRLVARAGSLQVDVVSTLVRFARGGDRIVAAVMTTALARGEPQPVAKDTVSLSELYGAFSDGSSLTTDGPEGQPRFRHRSMVVFREASEPSGGMRHTHYFSHMGKLRELATEPIMKDWVKDFLSGNWGAVTNRTRLVVSGEVQAGETLEGMVWSAGLSGPLGSTLELRFAWEALGAGGTRHLVAEGAMATTWVEVTGHGEAKLAPNPPYLQQFAERLRPPDERLGADLLPPSLEERGTLLNSHTRRPGQPPTFRATFNTTREQSNIVGNIYFAHFTSWQGEALDAMIAKLHPEYARSRTGELRVRHVVMEHFREAMPYEQVEVQLHLTGLWERGLSVSAEVFRRDGDHLVKLAAGEVDGTWYAPDAEGVWAPAPLPSDLVAKLEPFGSHTEEWRHGLTARTLA